MLDSGVRRGADILIALCLGARFLLHGPADALRRGGRRPARGQEGDRHLPQRDRSRHGPDRLPEPRPARPRFPVARRLARATHEFPLRHAAQGEERDHEPRSRHQYRRPAPDGEAQAAAHHLRLHRGRGGGRARPRRATKPRFTSTGCCRAIWSTSRSATSPRPCSAGPIRARSGSRRPAASASTGAKAR